MNSCVRHACSIVQTIVCADVVRHSVQAVFHRAFRQTKAIGNFLVREPLHDEGSRNQRFAGTPRNTTAMLFSRKRAGIHPPTLSIRRKSPAKEPFMVSTITSSDVSNWYQAGSRLP